MIMHTPTVFHILKCCLKEDHVLLFMKTVHWFVLEHLTSSLVAASLFVVITFSSTELQIFPSHAKSLF